ncbi:glycosyl hydrolase family 17 protein [Kordia antarctica]|nr:glycosyl hydrolase family 17 protein [Kordia antarctica]
MGVCYAPYHQAATVKKSSYTKENVAADLKIISANNMTFIRTYTVQGCQKYLPELCKKNNIGLALGVWIFQKDSKSTNAEIDTALTQANAHPEMVKVIVIGNEVDLAINKYTVAEVKAAFDYAVAQLKLPKYSNITNVPLTICMTGAGPTNATWSPLLNIMQSYAFLTIYPWYGQKGNHESNPIKFPMTPGEITGNMQYSYENGMKQAIAAGLEVVIAEIGWPSHGDINAHTTWKDEVTNFNATCKWINGTNTYNKAFITMWFEMFDEPWKTAEGLWGPHWGIYGSGISPTIKTDKSKTPFTKCS